MREYFYLILIITLLIIITFISHFYPLLSNEQINHLWISTLLFIILIGYLRNLLLYDDFDDTFKIGFFYVIWIIAIKLTLNLIFGDYLDKSQTQKSFFTDIIIFSIIVLLFYGFIRYMLLNEKLDTHSIIISTLLITIWYYFTNLMVDMSNKKMI